MFGGDEVGALVADFGTHAVRFGFAGESLPSVTFRSRAAVRPNDALSVQTVRAASSDTGPVAMDTSADTPAAGGASSASAAAEAQPKGPATSNGHYTQKTKERKLLYNAAHSAEHFASSSGVTDLILPVEAGLIAHWDAVETMFEHCFSKLLSVDVTNHPLLIADPVFNSRRDRERMAELLFEKFEAPAIFLAKTAVLAAFSVARSTGLVIDAGAGLMTVSPVHDGYLLNAAARRTRVAGDALDDLLGRILFSDQGRPVEPAYMFDRCVDAHANLSVKMLSDAEIQAIPASYRDFHRRNLLRDIKHSYCRVSDEPFDVQRNVRIPPVSYELPDGKFLKLSTERFSMAEELFTPKLVSQLPGGYSGGSAGIFEGIPSMVQSAIDACDPDVQKEMYGNIVIVGGTSILPRLDTRLAKELSARVPPAFKVKVASAGGATERANGVWMGGSILASLGSFHQMWFSRQEYLEGGAALLARKCP